MGASVRMKAEQGRKKSTTLVPDARKQRCGSRTTYSYLPTKVEDVSTPHEFPSFSRLGAGL
jgi:hypothetical protein